MMSLQPPVASHSPTSSTSSRTTTPTSPFFARGVSQHPYSVPHRAANDPPSRLTSIVPGNQSSVSSLSIKSWGSDDMSAFLRGCGCGHYAAAFARQDIDGRVVLDLDMAALKELGVAKVGERVKILAAVKDLRKRVSSSSSVSSPSIRSLKSDSASIMSTDSDSRFIQARDRLQATNARRVNVTRPPPLDLQPPHASGAQPLPQAYQSNDHAFSPSRSITPRPVPRIQRLDSSNTSDASSFMDRPLPPAPGAHSSAQSYALSVTQQQRSVDLDPPNRSNMTLAERRAQPQVAAIQASNARARRPMNGTSSSSHPFAARERVERPPAPAPATIPAARPAAVLAPPPKDLGGAKAVAPVANQLLAQPIPLEDLRKQLVKFINVEDGTTRTVNVSSCTSGVEILERVLKKFGKWQAGVIGSGTDTESDEDGDRLELDGWGVYADSDAETALLGICHGTASGREAAALRDNGLYLRRKRQLQNRKNMELFFGDVPPPPMSPASPNVYFGAPRLGYVQPGVSELLQPPSVAASKKMNRASTLSILSGLGVPGIPDAPPSPSTTVRSSSSGFLSSAKSKKMYNFFGHRPPSELISNHLPDYFPSAKRKDLEKTLRHSTMRMSTQPKRDSGVAIEPAAARASLDARRSRDLGFSPPRKSRPPSMRTISSQSTAPIPEEPEPPRGEAQSRPPLLPPLEPSRDSLVESLQAYGPAAPARRRPLSVRRNSGESTRSRVSMLTQLRRARDRSDTASMLTVDEITAEVENRASGIFEQPEDDVPRAASASEPEDEEEVEEGINVEEEEDDDEEDDDDEDEEDEEAVLESEEGEDEHGKAFTSTGAARNIKWIKGALIGAGSFGSVYLGMDAHSGLLMAVKQVDLPTGNTRNEERKRSMVQALEREIELLKELQHPNIVQYLDSSIDGSNLNIFLEYVPGGSVAALLSNYGAFEEALVRNFCRQILTGLNYLHEREIIHRDIKGANILVDNKGGIKISDFGISKKVESNLMTGMRANRPSLQGSVFWMAPEIVKQTSYTSKADIWSVGCLVVEMLTGVHPWADLTQMQAIFRIGSSAKPTTPSDVSVDASDLLQRTFEIDHDARPTAAELLDHPFIVAPKEFDIAPGPAVLPTLVAAR